MYTVHDLQAFQDSLPQYRLIAYSWPETCVLWKGPDGPPDSRNIFLLFDRDNNHVDLVTSPSAFLTKSYYCYRCLQGYDDPTKHRCGKMCPGCFKSSCPERNRPVNILCADCNRFFPGLTCFNNHKKEGQKGPALCNRIKLCASCGRRIDANDKRRANGQPHLCGEVFCKNCETYVPPNHLCFIKSATPTPEQKNKEKQEFAEHRIVYFDAEAYTNDDGQHVANLFVAIDNQTMTETKHSSTEEFCLWVFSAQNKNTTFIAHNAKGYDLYFVISWMLENSREKIEVIPCGGKLLMLKASAFNIQFIDSLSFLQTTLANMPKMFGLEQTIRKGFFPHHFNKPENYDYDGPMPPIESYGADIMPPERYLDFVSWYNKMVVDDYRFRFQFELESYCTDDVKVLLECCERFRETFFRTTSVDPFRHITIASACNQVYRKLDMPEETIAVIPSEGYANRNNPSHCATEWLCRLQRSYPENPIRHSRNGREIEVVVAGGHRYQLDGVFIDHRNPKDFDKNRRALEFAGCYIHGCSNCFNHSVRHPQRDKSMGELHDDFKRRNARLVDKGWHITVMWECEWRKLKKEKPEIRDFLRDLDLKPPLNPRDGFFGGRTNATQLHYMCQPNETIEYYDFTSLYPFINKVKRYPIGHPNIILAHEVEIEHFDITNYFGMIFCDILPPRNMYHPILPYRSRGKCMFPLCKTCCENAIPPPCNHQDRDRAFRGTWTTIEVSAAVEHGYTLLKVHEIWDFPESSNDLFGGYMNRFLAQKVEASGYLQDCQTDEDKDRFRRDYLRVEGVQLDHKNMKKNEAMRNCAKLMLNTLWGKFGQRNNLGSMKMVNTEEEFFQLLFSNQYIINSIQFFGERHVKIAYKEHDELCGPGLRTNVVIAAFTTAYARLHLWNFLNLIGERVLYFDTDSIIFIKRPGEYFPPLGDYLGDFTNEIKAGQSIVEFVSAGPKNYGYKLNTEETSLKVRGFSINGLAQRTLNYGTVRQMILDGGEAWERTIHVAMGDTIKRRKSDWSLHTVKNEKDYGFVYDKRFINNDGCTTVPWGSCL